MTNDALALADALEEGAKDEGTFLGPTDALLCAKALRVYEDIQRLQKREGRLLIVPLDYAPSAKAILEERGCIVVDENRADTLYAAIA